MGDLIKKAKSLQKNKFWREMFLVGPEAVDMMFNYSKRQHEQELKERNQHGAGLGPESNYEMAGRSTRNSLSRYQDPFMPTHEMPELNEKMKTWEIIGGHSEAINKYKQLLWLKSIKDAHIKHNISLPNGLKLRMVLHKINQIRNKYRQKFRDLNFGAYNLHEYVRIAPGRPPAAAAPAAAVRHEMGVGTDPITPPPPPLSPQLSVTPPETPDIPILQYDSSSDDYESDWDQVMITPGSDIVTFRQQPVPKPAEEWYPETPAYTPKTQSGSGMAKTKKQWVQFIPIFDVNQAWTQVL